MLAATLVKFSYRSTCRSASLRSSRSRPVTTTPFLRSLRDPAASTIGQAYFSSQAKLQDKFFQSDACTIDDAGVAHIDKKDSEARKEAELLLLEISVKCAQAADAKGAAVMAERDAAEACKNVERAQTELRYWKAELKRCKEIMAQEKDNAAYLNASAAQLEAKAACLVDKVTYLQSRADSSNSLFSPFLETEDTKTRFLFAKAPTTQPI